MEGEVSEAPCARTAVALHLGRSFLGGQGCERSSVPAEAVGTRCGRRMGKGRQCRGSSARPDGSRGAGAEDGGTQPVNNCLRSGLGNEKGY